MAKTDESLHFYAENIGQLSKAEIHFRTNALNIKYGFNGIGKSTVVKAIEAEINGNDSAKKLLCPLGNKGANSSIQLQSNFKSVLIFNNDYFNNRFSKNSNDILNNTYELVVKSEEYEEIKAKIHSLFADLKSVVSREEITNLLTKFLPRIDAKKQLIGKNAKSTILSYYYKNGAVYKLDGADPIIEKYADYLESPYKASWIKWLRNFEISQIERNEKGQSVCPFCAQTFAGQELISQIQKLDSEIDQSAISSHTKDQQLIDSLADYVSNEDKKEQILQINTISEKVTTEDVEPAESFRQVILKETPKLIELQILDGVTLLKQLNGKVDAESITKKLENLKIDDSISIKTSDGQDLIKLINYKLIELTSKVKELADLIERQNESLIKSIKENIDQINAFMELAGIPYKSLLIQNDDSNYVTDIAYKDAHDLNPLSKDRLSYLSYGEANALSVILFAIEARKSEGLIILDDPVSSFDSNKQRAIYSALFGEGGLLNGKTVLLFTHDFPTIITFMSTGFKKVSVNYAYLSKNGSILSEIPFCKKNLKKCAYWYKKYSQDNSKDIVSRLAAVRIASEMGTSKGDNLLYNFVSSVLHEKDIPSFDKESENLFEEEDIKSSEELLKTFISDNGNPSYSDLVSKIKDHKQLINLYKNATTKFAKFTIARTLYENSLDKVKRIKRRQENPILGIWWDSISQVFHVEAKYIYLIDNVSEDDIPDYVLNITDKIVDSLNEELADEEGNESSNDNP